MITFEEFTDSIYPMYLVKIDSLLWSVTATELVDIFDGLYEVNMPSNRCIRIVCDRPIHCISGLTWELVRVDPLLWSHDFSNMYGYLLYFD